MTNPRVLIIIPAHNEAESLPGTLAEVRAHAPHVDLLVVDDGSHDGTARAARDLAMIGLATALGREPSKMLIERAESALDKSHETSALTLFITEKSN